MARAYPDLSDSQENIIHTTSRVVGHKADTTSNRISSRRSIRRLFKKSKKRIIRYAILTANVALLAGVVMFVVQNPNASTAAGKNALADSRIAANPLDQVSSAEIAVSVAKMVNMDSEETKAVINGADTVNIMMSMPPADEKVVAKPQVVATALKTKKDIIRYTSVQGDTVQAIATKFNVTTDSVKWSNGLSGNAVPAGKQLLIPPISNGIVYVVKQGDTPDTLATRFHANKEQIAAFNDAEVSGLKVGDTILIPDGSIRPVVTYAAASSSSTPSWGGSFNPVYGGNGYPFGQCTWWASYRRAQIGRPIPNNLGNANTWKLAWQRSGMPNGAAPQVGAVIWFTPGGSYSTLGHVGVVERVNPDGSVYVSDMNFYGGADSVQYLNGRKVSYRTIPVSQLRGTWFLY